MYWSLITIVKWSNKCKLICIQIMFYTDLVYYKFQTVNSPSASVSFLCFFSEAYTLSTNNDDAVDGLKIDLNNSEVVLNFHDVTLASWRCGKFETSLEQWCKRIAVSQEADCFESLETV